MSIWVKAALMASIAGILPATAAQAEVNEVNIASTLGLAQFPGRVAYQLGFIQKRAEQDGIGNLKVNYQAVTSGVIVADLFLSGHANIGIGGNVPMFSLWNKTGGHVKGIMAFSQGDMFLNTCDPRIKTIRDYTDHDRIAMTDLKVTTYSMLLQMEAAKVFGWENRNKFGKISVGMGNSDGMAAIISCATDVKSHMTILPHSTMELASGKAHTVFSSEQLLGHPYTFVAAFTNTDFKKNNPKVYKAVVEGFGDAIKFIQNDPAKAAAMYLKAEPFPGTRDTVEKLIKGETPDHFSYTETPNSTKDFLDFMAKSGMIKASPKSWKDVWFDNVWNLPGT